MKRYKKLFENDIKVSFETGVSGSVGDEIKAFILAFINNKKVGKLNYTIYNKEYYIDYIEVDSKYKGQGIAKKMIVKLILFEKIRYRQIEWDWMTPDGFKLKKKLDKIFK